MHYASGGESLNIGYRRYVPNEDLQKYELVDGSVILTTGTYNNNPVLYSMFIKEKEGNLNVAYLVYQGFDLNYAEELKYMIQQFKTEGITDLILDLRYNYGGAVELYSPQCYWKCATTFGSQLRPYKLMYPLLDEITNWFRKIDFMIIGTQKGGSTAHPSCWGSFFKEPGFFLYPTEYAKGFPFFMEYMWKEYPPFRYSLSDSLLFESTTWYSYWYEVPERLFEYNPHLKFIFLVRNPIDRAYSQYNMLINWRKSQLLHEYELFPDKEKLNILLKK